MAKKYGAFTSSQNPEELAMRVKGILVAIIPVAVFVLHGLGINIVEGELNALTDIIKDLILYGMSAVGAALHIYGWYRKIVNKPHDGE